MARILVIDDSRSVALFVAHHLPKHEVEALGSFVDLPRRLRTDPPDIVLLDLHMPAMDGISVAGFIARFAIMAPAILVYSSVPRAQAEEAARHVGAVACIQKSTDPGELVTAIELALEGRPSTCTTRRLRLPGRSPSSQGMWKVPMTAAELEPTRAS